MLKGIISEKTIMLDLEVSDKIDLFHKIVEVAQNLGYISDAHGVIEDFYEKEQNTETYLGTKCAIPHARSSRILNNTIFYIRLKNEIKWADDEYVKYIFAVLAKENEVDKHIDMLMNVSKKILEPKVFEALKTEKDEKEIEKIMVE